MADQRLTDRSELAAAPADTDLVHIVDVSDTTDNASGTSKKITITNLIKTYVEALTSYFNVTSDNSDAITEGASNLFLTTAERSKLSGIETAADVTDTANVTAAGALMDSEVTNLAQVKAFSSADYAAASHTHATTDITSGTFADARIAQSNVTQHQAALTLTEAQVEAALSAATAFTAGNFVFNTDQTVGVGQDNYVLTYDHASGEIGLEVAAGAGGGDAWSDPVDADIVPATDSTYDVGSSASRFSQGWFDGLYGIGQLDANTSSFDVNDANSLPMASFSSVGATAVNEVTLGNSATGNAVTVSASGSDTNISLNFVPKGSGEAQVAGQKIIDETDTASDTAAGIVELATNAETQTGTDTARATTPAGVAAAIGDIPLIKAITIESPTSSEDISMFFTDDAITVTQMNAVLVGSSTPSVTWTVRHSTDRSAAGNEVVTSGTTTTSTTTGSEVTSFNDATIPAGSWVKLQTTAQSGTVTELSVSIEYTRD